MPHLQSVLAAGHHSQLVLIHILLSPLVLPAPQPQFLCIVNTLLSLLGATIATFAASALVNKGRLDMVHIQNSTIAGGVAMGAACTLQMVSARGAVKRVCV